MLLRLHRSWRVLVLAWAVMLAPQVSMLHALSHTIPGGAPHSGESEKRKQAPAKVCESCLALAQLGSALPAGFHWIATEASPPSHSSVASIIAAIRVVGAYRARAPPLLSS